MDRRALERRKDNLTMEIGSAESPFDSAMVESREAQRRTGPRSRRGMLGQRTRFLVPGTYQLKAILGVSGLAALLLLILNSALYRLQEARSEKILQAVPELSKIIIAQDRMQMGLILLASAVGLLAVVVIVLFESHKTAGPIYDLTNVMRRFADEGGGVRVRFRRDDHFQELAEAFNALAASVDHQTQDTAARAGLVAAALRRIAHDFSGAARSSELAERLGNVANELDVLAQGRVARPSAGAGAAEGGALTPAEAGAGAFGKADSPLHAGR